MQPNPAQNARINAITANVSHGPCRIFAGTWSNITDRNDRICVTFVVLYRPQSTVWKNTESNIRTRNDTRVHIAARDSISCSNWRSTQQCILRSKSTNAPNVESFSPDVPVLTPICASTQAKKGIYVHSTAVTVRTCMESTWKGIYSGHMASIRRSMNAKYARWSFQRINYWWRIWKNIRLYCFNNVYNFV